MKKSWETCNLEDYINLIDYRGRTPVKTESGIRLITAKNVKLGFLQLEPQEFIAENNYESWMTRGIPNYGDVIFTTEAPLANVAQINMHEKLAFAQRIIVMQPKRNKIDATFLKYMLLSPDLRNKILEKGTGATVQGIKQSLLRKIKISFPSIPEQQLIVDILDKAFEAIDQAKANSEKNLQNAKELFKCELNSIFIKARGYGEKKLGEVCFFVRGPFGGSLKKEIFKNSGIAVYEQQHAIYNQFSDIRYFIKEEKFSEMKRFELLSGDLIMSCSGTMGKVAIVPVGIQKGIINQALLKLTPNKNLIVEYLKFYMESFPFQFEIAKHSQGAAIQNVASVSILKQINLPFPNIGIQEQIVNHLETLRVKTKQLEDYYQKKLDSLEELKKSILQKAFSGELTRQTKEIEMEQLDLVVEDQRIYQT